MHRASTFLLAVVLSTGLAMLQPANRLMAAAPDSAEISAQASQQATLKPTTMSSPDIPFDSSELQVEQQLLQLANQSRQRAGVATLTLDAGLSEAARVHAQAMLDARQLSHQFEGEPTLPERLAAATRLQLEQEGENVALDYDAVHGHEHLMLSPPHRANLLNPAYNVIGLGVVRSGTRLYIVEDFGRALPSYSVDELKDWIAGSVNQTRRRANLPALPRQDLDVADSAACSMEQADKLGTPPVRKLAERFSVMTFTSLHPETLPSGALHAIASHNLHSFSIGACYGRTATYPTGVYWVVISLD
jgi:uncharacterized protein YkwD